jgi:hypothetical protein
MKTAARSSLLMLATLIPLAGCDKPSSSGEGAAASASAVASSAPSAATTPSAVPSAAPSAAAEPPHECPAGSSGAGSFANPCEAKGKDRMMDVSWVKTGDNGPTFSVKSKSKLTILYGKVVVYFYDKAGKQLDVTDGGMPGQKPRPFHVCTGASLFGGEMKPNDKYDLTFSCVPKKVIPADTAKIEAEIQTVGFADATGKKVDFYWRNPDLSPEQRPKGGAK